MQPGQDRPERHGLVQGQVDHAGEHARDARDKEHRRDGADPPHVRGKLGQETEGHELQSTEREDDAVRGALVQEFVQGERDDPDEQQADTERDHEGGRDEDGPGIADGPARGGQREAHVRGDAGGRGHRAAGDHAGVEGVTRCVGEHPQTTEVQVPPQRVGCRERGGTGHEAEHRGGEQDPRRGQSPPCAEGGGQGAVCGNGGLCSGWHRVPII